MDENEKMPDEFETGAAAEGDVDEVVIVDEFVEVEIMEASMSAFGSVVCDEFDGRYSAIGSASVAGDAELGGSLVGAINAESVALRQGVAGAMVVSGDAAISQGCAPMVIAQSVEMESSGACMVVTGDASVARSWVGFMAARNATVSDDSRIIIDTRAGLIIGGLLFGGLGLLAVAVYLGARRIAERVPHLPHLPHLPQMPHLADLRKSPEFQRVAAMVGRLHRAG